MENTETESLLQLAERKLVLLAELKTLTVDQQLLVSEQQIDKLLLLLSRKSQTLDDLKGIQEQLAVFQSQTPEERVWSSGADRQRCRDCFQQCDMLLAELLAIENSSLDELSQHRDLVAQQLNQHTTAEAIHDAYQGVDSYEVDSQSTFSMDG